MEPIVDGIEEEYSTFDIIRISIDTGRGQNLAREYGFVGQPTFIFVDSQGEQVRRLQGPQAHETLALEIEKMQGE